MMGSWADAPRGARFPEGPTASRVRSANQPQYRNYIIN
jgi:hypothetical protein